MGCCRCWSAPNTKDAYRLSIASLLITVLAAWGGIVFFMRFGSSLCLVYGLENIIDFISSAIVLWRFFAPEEADDALEQRLKQREQRASIGISFTMILLGLSVVSASISDFRRGKEDEFEEAAIIFLSFFSVLFFGTLAVLKFRYAANLDSPSLYKDGICSLIGTVLAGFLFINTIIIAGLPGLWWIDPLVALFAGIFAMGLGVKAIWEAATKEMLPIFTIGWWFDNQAEENPPPKNSNIELPPADGETAGEII